MYEPSSIPILNNHLRRTLEEEEIIYECPLFTFIISGTTMGAHQRSIIPRCATTLENGMFLQFALLFDAASVKRVPL